MEPIIVSGGSKVHVPPNMTAAQKAVFDKKIDWLNAHPGVEYPQGLKEEMYEAGVWKPTTGKAAWGMSNFLFRSRDLLLIFV